MKKKINLTLLQIVLAIPLAQPADWVSLRFSRIPPNHMEFSAKGLEIKVDQSASPLIYPFKEPILIKSIAAEMEIEGEIKSVGTKWPEDAYLRFGIVAPGKRRLGMVERMISADWIKQLFKLAGPDQGVDKIYFFSLVAPSPLLNQKRIMPKSKNLIEESIVALRPAADKNIHFHYTLNEPLNAMALWISSDGDDSHAKYTLRIKSLLVTKAEAR